MAIDLMNKPPGSDEDSRTQRQYAQHFSPHSTQPGTNKAGSLYNAKGENRAGSLAGGTPRLGGTDKTGGTAQKLAEATAPEVAGLVNAAQKLQGVLTGTPGRRRNTIIGTGGVVTIVLVVLGISIILPDELISLMTDLEQHFFASVEHDLTKYSDKLMSKYIQKRILARLGPGCTSSADLAKCASMKTRPGGTAATTTDDPIEGQNGLYDKWDGSDIAGQFKTHGVTFTSEGGKLFMNHTDLPGGTYDISHFATTAGANLFEDPVLIKSGFATTLESVKEALVVSRGAYLHRILTVLVQAHVGGKWCFVDCNPGNEAQDQSKLTAADEKVAGPAAQASTLEATATAVADMEACLTDPNCDPGARTPDTTPDDPGVSEPAAPDANAPKSPFEKLLESDLANLVPFDITQIKTLYKTFSDLKATGTEAVANAIADAIGKVTGADVTKEVVQQVIDKFGPIGWINGGAQVVKLLGTAGQKIAIFNSTIKGVMTLHTLMTNGSAVAELKSGSNHTTSTMFGTLNTLLHAKGQAAESSPIVLEAIDPQHNKNLTHQIVQADEVKNHESFSASSNALTKVSDVLNSIPGFKYVEWLATLITKIVGLPLSAINTLVSQLFNITGINKLLALAIGPLIAATIHYLVPLPNLTDLSGQDTGALLAGGTDYAGSLAAQASGGMALSGQQAAVLTNEQLNAEYQQFKQRPFFARMFSVDTPYSFVSQLSMTMPTNSFSSTIRNSFAGLLENPFGKIFGGLSTVLQPTSAFAASTNTSLSTEDDIGITYNGILDTDPVFANTPAGDPDTYLKQHNCAQEAAQGWPTWNAATVTNPDNGMVEHTTTNGCLLAERVIQAAGALAGYGQ